MSLNPVPKYRYVADILCEGKYGRFTTQATASEGQTALDAVNERIETLEGLKNTILEITYRNVDLAELLKGNP